MSPSPSLLSGGQLPPLPPDPVLDAAAGLLTGEGAAALGEFLRARGWEAKEIRPVQALYRPGRSLAVRFDARAHAADGRPASFILTAEARAGGAPLPCPPAATPDAAAPGRPVIGLRFTPVSDPVAAIEPYLVWAFPYDPSLPGLAAATCSAVVAGRLGGARSGDGSRSGRRTGGGLDGTGGDLVVEALRYRPRRRAVLRYRSDGANVSFVKVLPRARAEAILRTTRCLPARLPVDLGLAIGRVAPGALVLRAMKGRTLRDLLLRGDRVPAPDRVTRLTADLALIPTGLLLPPDGEAERGRVRLAAAERAGAGLTHLSPALAAPVGRIIEAVTAGLAGDPVPDRTVHGDLYENQIVVGPNGPLALIDLDDLGAGDPVLDAATFSAHLLTLSLSAGDSAARILAYRAELREAFLRRLDVSPAALAWREAYALLLLSTGPFRVLHPHWPHHVTERVHLAADLLATHDQGGRARRRHFPRNAPTSPAPRKVGAPGGGISHATRPP